MKIKPCSSADFKHTWKYRKNATTGSASVGPRGKTVRMTLRGVYRCATCGEAKFGTPRFSAEQPVAQP